jgi:hypothetical protein
MPAASGGAVVMARAEQDLQPLEMVTSVLLDQIRAATV